MERYVSYENEVMEIEAMSGKEYHDATAEQVEVVTSHEWVWQIADSHEQAIAQHVAKHDEWSDDQQAGRTEKNVY